MRRVGHHCLLQKMVECTQIKWITSKLYFNVPHYVLRSFYYISICRLVIGLPDCGSKQRWPIYHYQNSSDVLRLLPNGVLRHYTHYAAPLQPDFVEYEIEEDTESVYYDYQSGKYCLEKVHMLNVDT